MGDPTLAYEDMLFFERRLTEVISGMHPKVRKWRIFLLVLLFSTACSAYFWVSDPSLRFISLWESLMRHPLFTTCIILLLISFLFFGVHKRVVAPKIVALRCRSVLADFCLSCDEHGKLIVRPAYPSHPSVSPPLPSYNAPPPQRPSSQSTTAVAASPHNSSAASFGSMGFDLVEEESLLVEPNSDDFSKIFLSNLRFSS